MYTIELMLKGNPAPVSVQLKEEEAATAVYQKLLTAVQKGEPRTVELSCDRTSKKVVVLTSEICTVQFTPKAGTSNPMGSRTGFLSQTESLS